MLDRKRRDSTSYVRPPAGSQAVQVVGRREVRVEGAAEHADEQVGAAAAPQVGHGRHVVAAGPQRVAVRQQQRLRRAVQRRRAAAAGVADQQHARLEEVAPQQVQVAVAVHVHERHGVRAVARPELGDDLDPLEPVGDEAEPRRAGRMPLGGLVAGDRAVDAAEEEIRQRVAVDVGHLRDVLPVGEDRRALGIAQRIGRLPEPRRRRRTGVLVVAHVAERLLGQQVEVTVVVHVVEAAPLAHRQVVPAIGAPGEVRRRTRAGVLEEDERVAALLDEEVQVAVAVDVHELRPRHVEAAQERESRTAARRRRAPRTATRRALPIRGRCRRWCGPARRPRSPVPDRRHSPRPRRRR